MARLLFGDDGPAGAGFELPDEGVVQHKFHPCAADAHFKMGGEQVTTELVRVFFAIWHDRFHHNGDGISIPE